MSGRARALLCLAGMIALMTSAQLMFKMAGLHAHNAPDWIRGLALNVWLWAAFVVSAAGLVCWLAVLRQFPLNSAYPWTALIYAFTPLLSKVFFNDALNGSFYCGMTLIVIGIFLTAGGVRPR